MMHHLAVLSYLNLRALNMNINMDCSDLTKISRFKTREVFVGDIGIGADNPIRLQSMTTTDTMDTNSSVEQIVRMIQSGCEIVRLTAPSIKEAKNLYEIKNKLLQKGYTTPLVADIHFTPNAALEAAKIVEKVRINPGNFSDRKKFKIYQYSTKSYLEELKRIEEKFFPLIDICKKNKTVLRIGTNHGSLSDRIMSQYGDTPMGMVESALEFVRICEKYAYHDIILSMKSSNPIIMVQAYRMLVHKMKQENMNYPIHLGVTEAGEGDDARIKSALGIGSLLVDGIGDTIRVSLTEPPENEIPVGKQILSYIKQIEKHSIILKESINPFIFSRRKTYNITNIGHTNAPVVITDFSDKKEITYSDLNNIGYNYSEELDKWNISDTASDYIFIGDNNFNFNKPGPLKIIYNYKTWTLHEKGYPLLTVQEYLKNIKLSKEINFISIYLDDLSKDLLKKISKDQSIVLIICTNNINSLCDHRKIFIEFINNQVKSPVVIRKNYNIFSREKLQIHASIDFGALFLDGLGDGIFISNKRNFNNKKINQLEFDILQATRTRISKTEYISCPSCGRTQFDLESTTAKIRKATSHLKGLKIGIMGCIVNGPGEMADADYGYVGTGKNKISLYKKKEMVKSNIDTKDALCELIQLIKDHGDWVNP